MKQVEDIKAMIREMMDQEMKNFKEAVSCGDGEESMSPGIYTMLQVLLAKIENMPPAWHDVSEEADLSQSVILYDEEGGYMSPPCKFPFKDMPGFVYAMNRKFGANYTRWIYMKDILPVKEE